ncbi:MAG: carboxynorspermidine decarboxylase, partial [Dysgonamonadaceae bacterium]|nr:carboxynorspermidine decarboxylase [Dysgonamonadaceae bacterium]
MDFSQIPSPCFVMDETLLRRNLQLIQSVKERARVNIILAFKAFALWRTFPIVREYIAYSTASSVNEARLAFEDMGSLAHSYAPAYTDADFPTFLKYSSHITFNSLSQFERFYPQVVAEGGKVKCGLRVNPEFSLVETELYNPSATGSRLGVTADLLGDRLPEGISGLHIHNLCENNSFDLQLLLDV